MILNKKVLILSELSVKKLFFLVFISYIYTVIFTLLGLVCSPLSPVNTLYSLASHQIGREREENTKSS